MTTKEHLDRFVNPLQIAIEDFPMDIQRLALQRKKLWDVLGNLTSGIIDEDSDYMLDEIHMQLCILCERFTVYSEKIERMVDESYDLKHPARGNGE